MVLGCFWPTSTEVGQTFWLCERLFKQQEGVDFWQRGKFIVLKSENKKH